MTSVRSFFDRHILFSVVLTLFLVGGCASAQGTQDDRAERPTNVILMISDGTGPATVTMARDYARDVLGRDGLALDQIAVGTAQTFATDSRITDSAAGATAFSSGVKTYNGAIAMDTLRRPVATILEAAEARGMATGLVATSRVTHATPASFASHVPSRSMENEIAEQMIGKGVDVIFGGGRRHFLPESADGQRTDGRDLLETGRELGYQVLATKEDIEGPLTTPVLGLFTVSDMSYDIDRNTSEEPSLTDMTVKALDLLDDDPDGFFLMVEGSRIDHAAHGNDAAAHLHDMLAYDAAVAAVLDFARRDGRTLVISVADHETGGLTLGRRGASGWNPDVLSGVRASHDPIVNQLTDGADLESVLATYVGIDDLSDDERELFETAGEETSRLNAALTQVVGHRAGVGWTTGGHTAVDVNLYAFGPGRESFIGNLDNAEIGRRIAELMGLDLASATLAMQ
jgi:alkaline phosphatase